MAIAAVLSKIKGSSDGITATTTSGDNSGANFGIAIVASVQSATNFLTITDSVGNRWVLYDEFINSDNKLSIYTCDLPITSATYTITCTSIGNSPLIAVKFFSGVRLPSVVHLISTLTTGTSGSFAAPTLPAPSEDNCVGISAVCALAGGTLTPSVGTYDSLIVNAQGNHAGGGLAHLIQTSAATFGPTWGTLATYARVAVNLAIQPETATESVRFLNFAHNRIIQRAAGATTKSMAVSGTYTSAGTPDHIQGRVLMAGTNTEALTWTTITGATIAAGSWSGTLASLPQGGPYNIQFRSRNSSNTVLATSMQSNFEFYVGILINTVGQSNMAKLFQAFTTSITSNPRTKMFDASGWRTVEGDGAITLANILETALNIPIGLLNYAVSGSGLHYDAGSGDWQSLTAGQPWPLNSAGITSAGGDVEFVIARNGEADALGLVSAATFKTSTETLYGRIRTLTGRSTSTLHWLQAIMGKLTAATLATDASISNIRTGQYNIATATTGATCAGSFLDGTLVDDFHFGVTHYVHAAHRYAQAVLEVLDVAQSGALGPRITAATRIGTSSTIRLTIDHEGGTGLTEADLGTAGADLTGFEISDDDWATTIDILSTAFNSDDIVIVLADNPASSADLKIRYQYGLEPVTTNMVYDNTVPTNDSLGIPLLPLNSLAVGDSAASSSASTRRTILSTSGRLPTTTTADVGYKVLAASGVELAARTNEGVFQSALGDDYGIYQAEIEVEDTGSILVVWDDGDGEYRENIIQRGTTTVSPFLVTKTRTWDFQSHTQLTSPKLLNEFITTFDGLLSMDFTEPMHAESSIDDIISADFEDITGTEPVVVTTSVSPNKKRVDMMVDCSSATAGTYTVAVTIVTTDSQTITRKGRLVVQ